MMKQIRAISRTLLISYQRFCACSFIYIVISASQGNWKAYRAKYRQQKNLSSQQKKLDSLQANLKKQELSIASLEKAILDSKKQLNTKPLQILPT